MNHPRLIAGNSRVALLGQEKLISAARYVSGQPKQVAAPVADLLRKPGGGLDRQLLRGEGFLVIEDDPETGFAFGQCHKDGYVGHILAKDLQKPVANTHRVTALATHIYGVADMKTRPVGHLSFGSKVAVSGQSGDFATLINGHFIPRQHLGELQELTADYTGTLERFLGIPYLWGGDSIWGMDCSGAVQIALGAAGRECLRDTDMQEVDLGARIPADAPLKRGDFIFWKGHVGVMQNARTLIHANAYHMAVASEPLEDACVRIRQSGGGEITARKRL